MAVEDDVTERATLLLRGSLDMCVLALIDREPMHAYAVVQRLADHGFQHTGYGTIYPLTARLRRLGLLDQRSEQGRAGPARHLLSTTAAGRAALGRWTAQWHETVERVAGVLAPREERHVG
ncbi:MAG: PadR family transcriptional regulator [Nocardioides sp.]